MKRLKIFVASGIGDSVWALSKIPDMRKQLNPDRVEIIAQHTEFNRCHEFLMHFQFVDSVRYDVFSILPEPIYLLNPFDLGKPIVSPADSDGFYVYIDSTDNYMDNPDSWLLLANSHLEHGNRLEDWYLESGFENDIDLAKYWKFSDDELTFAESFQTITMQSDPFMVFYMGPLGGNTQDGHNRNSLWTLRDWQIVQENLSYINPNLKFVIVGAKQDWQYANLFMGTLTQYFREKTTNFCGKTTIGECFALIKQSRFILSYPCGIGVFSAYMGHPSAIFYRPYGDSFSSQFHVTYDERLSHDWCPQEYINKTYFPLIYTKHSPNQVTDIISRFV